MNEELPERIELPETLSPLFLCKLRDAHQKLADISIAEASINRKKHAVHKEIVALFNEELGKHIKHITAKRELTK